MGTSEGFLKHGLGNFCQNVIQSSEIRNYFHAYYCVLPQLKTPAERFWLYSSAYVSNPMEAVFTRGLQSTRKNIFGIKTQNLAYEGLA